MTFTQGFVPLALAPIFPQLIKEFNSSPMWCNLSEFQSSWQVSVILYGVMHLPEFSINMKVDPIRGSNQYDSWQTTCTHFVHARMSGQLYLESKGANIFKLHGACVLGGFGVGPSEVWLSNRAELIHS